AGACGALAPALATGDLVVPEAVVATDGVRYATDAVAGLTRVGTLLTVEDVVATVAAKSRLWMETGAIAVDMESAAIVAWARARGLRVAIVRGVSDTATEAGAADPVALVDGRGRGGARRAGPAAPARPRAPCAAVPA